MKRISWIALMLILISSASSFSTTTNNPFAIYVNGKSVTFTDAKPFINSNARTMIPLRAVSETMGAVVTWDQKTQTALIAMKDRKVQFLLNKNYAYVDGVKVVTDATTVLVNERVFIPLRFVSENLNYTVTYKFGLDPKSVKTEKYHIIDIASYPGSLVERGFGSVMPPADYNHPEKFFPSLSNVSKQVQMIEDSIHFDGTNPEMGAFDPDISIWYTKKGLVSISFKSLPPEWDYFMKQALRYMMGPEGTEIGLNISKTLAPYKTGTTYNTSKVVGKTFTVGRFKTTFKSASEIQITFVEK